MIVDAKEEYSKLADEKSFNDMAYQEKIKEKGYFLAKLKLFY